MEKQSKLNNKWRGPEKWEQAAGAIDKMIKAYSDNHKTFLKNGSRENKASCQIKDSRETRLWGLRTSNFCKGIQNFFWRKWASHRRFANQGDFQTSL